MCRLSQTGLYTYIWNVLHSLCRLEHGHRLILFLYGQPGIEEPEPLRRMIAAFPQVEVRYVWDDFRLKLLSNRYNGDGSQAPKWIKQLDRNLIFPVWKKLLIPDSRLSLHASRLARLFNRTSALPEVDVFHHPAGLVFPLNSKANVMTLSDLIPHHFPYYCPGSDAWFEESFAKADQMDIILTYSEYTKQDIIETLRVDEDKIRVIPLAAHEQYRPVEDQKKVQTILTKYGLGEGSYIIYVGTIEARKNISRLVEAFHLLKQENPLLEHQLVLVGGKLWMHEPIFEAISQLGLENSVKWLGHVPFEDLPSLLDGAELFIFPSLYEGFGLPPLEAMSCGTPVVCSHASSLPEVVGDAGLLFDPYRVKDIAETMHRVLIDSQLRYSLREKGLKRSRTFSWEKTAQATLSAYEEAWARFQDKQGRELAHGSLRCEKTKNYPHVHGWVIEQVTRQMRGKTNDD